MKVNHMRHFVACALLGCCMAAVTAACSEDDITPSEDNRLVVFPQGTNSYDNDIADLYQKYGTQMLYKYNDAMFRWQITDQLGYVSRQAEESCVADAVGFIKENCFRFYSDDSLRTILPYRIYLASNLGRLFEYSGTDIAGNYVTVNDTIWQTAATYGYANICVALATPRLKTMSRDSLRLAKGELNASVLAYAASQGFISIPASFTREEVSGVSWNNYVGSYNTYGLLEYLDPKTIQPAEDFALFLKYMIAYPEEEFNERFCTANFDPSGRIARKAKAVREWMLAQYGIDIEHMAQTEITR